MAEPLLSVSHLRKVYAKRGGLKVAAVDDVTFAVEPGACVGLVGGSGCGKSTIARLVTGLEAPTSGTVFVNGVDCTGRRGRSTREAFGCVQMVFQDPASSFDPRRTLGYGVAESLCIRGMGKAEARRRVSELFERCGLSPELKDRLPREVSGGQCQRAAIARALAPEPALIVCDEATSALDVTVQAQIVDLLRQVRDQSGCAYLFICHDLALVQGLCDRVLVMREGHIVEQGSCDEVLGSPVHPYTRELLDAVLTV